MPAVATSIIPAEVRIVDLTQVTSLTGSELFEVVQGNSSFSASIDQISAVSSSITRAQIATKVLAPTITSVITNGYSTSGDLGAGAIYTSVGATSGGLLAIQDAGGTWFNLVTNGLINAGWFGATGNGSTDDTTALQNAINAAFVNVNAGGNKFTNLVLFIPQGKYITSAVLTITGASGAIMRGAGRWATQIIRNSGSGNVFTTNGCEYCLFEDMAWISNAGTSGAVMNLDWDGVSHPAGAALQSNTFKNIYFQMFGSSSFGCLVANSGNMGSENLWLECFFAGGAGTSLGLSFFGGNALMNSVIACNFASCGVGIKVQSGSCPVIHGVSFQSQATFDIQVVNAAEDTYSIAGCRSETNPNFCSLGAAAAAISGCVQTSTSSGVFVTGGKSVSMRNCTSVNGQIQNTAGSTVWTVDGCSFGRTDPLDHSTGNGAKAFFINSQYGQTWDATFGSTPTFVRAAYFDNNPNTIRYLPGTQAVLALTDGATINTDASQSHYFSVTIAGNRTLANPTNLADGQTYVWFVTQDVTGGRTLAFGNAFVFPGPQGGLGPPVLQSGGGHTDTIIGYYDGTSIWSFIPSVRSLQTGVPDTQTGSTYTIVGNDYGIIANNNSTSLVITMDATVVPGRLLKIKTIQNQAVFSASSNIVPINGTTAGTSILTNSAGKWADLQSDGTNWVIMASN